MPNSVTFDLFARDRASGSFTKVGQAAEGAGKKVHGLGGAFGAVTAGSRGLRTSFGLIGKGAALAAGAAGLGGLIEGFKAVYGEAREAQKVGAQTAAVIKSTGGVAHVSAKQVGDLATAISNKVGVDDEAIQSGANLLLTFTGVRNEAGKGNRIFDQATQTITDMAAAMNQGAVTTDGLKTASIQVGKALQDPIKGITALRKVGVAFNDQQIKQIKTMVKSGNTLGAQKVILKELNREFAGSAAAGATASQKLGVVFKNIEESIGTALLPAIDAVSNWLAKELPGAIGVAMKFLGDFGQAVRDGLGGKIPENGGVFAWVARVSSVLRDFAGGARKLAEHVRASITLGLAGFIPATGGPWSWITKATTALKDFATWVKTTGIPAILDAFTAVKLDLSPIAAQFVTSAKTWAGSIIDGVQKGLDTGDWSGLGKAVGDGLVSAVTGTADLASKLGGALAGLLGKVDWFAVGEAVGKTALPFVIGFTNTLIDGLFTVAKEHPFDTALFIVSFLGVGKIGGIIARVLEKIPFLKVFAPLFRGIETITKPLTDTIGKVVGSIGREFLKGLGIEIPHMGKALSGAFDGLRLRIWYFANGFGEAGLGLVRRAGEGVRAGVKFLGGALADVAGFIGKFLQRLLGPIAEPFFRAGSNLISRMVSGIRSVFRALGGVISEVISRLTAPFRSAGSWLIRKGVDLITGLVRGVGSMLGSAARAVGRVISAVVGKFAGAAGWLLRAGGDLIRGLLNGATSALSGVGRWIANIGGKIVGAVKHFFGIHSPSTVFAGLGGHLVDGLIKGMLERNPAALVGKVFGGMTGAIRTLFTKGLLGNVTNLGGKAISALGGLASSALGAIGGNAPSSVSGNAALVKGMAQAFFGWQGGEWDALYKLVSRESSFNNTAQNPTSSAYGLFQFLDSTWGAFGIGKTSNPNVQTQAGLQYIKQRYGDPINAWGHEMQFGWYGSGMAPTVFNRPTVIGVGERGPEMVSVTPLNGRGGDAALVQEIRALRRQIAALAPETGREVGREVGRVLSKGARA